MYKWLTILFIVLAGFLLVLLSLGYLLKENEEHTTRLKKKLEQKSVQAQGNKEVIRQVRIELRTAPEKAGNKVKLSLASSQAQRQQDIIIANLTCQNDQQCVLVPSELAGEQCWLAVNTIGAVLLKKLPDKPLPNKLCYQPTTSKVAACENNLCSIKPQVIKY